MTPDHRLSVVIKGDLDLEIRRAGVWRRAPLRPGSAIMIPGGQTQLMRWSGRGAAGQPEIVHVFLPPGLLSWATERSRMTDLRGGLDATEPPPFHDPVVATVARSLLNAIRRKTPDPYAESTVQWLAMHLVSAPGGHNPDEHRHVVDRNVARAVEYMGAHLSEPLTLDILAREAGISKFHFSRRFRSRTGATPISYLSDLRLEAARRLLATTDDPVGRVAHACGYRRGSHFGTAFARRYGETPSAFRRRSRQEDEAMD